MTLELTHGKQAPETYYPPLQEKRKKKKKRPLIIWKLDQETLKNTEQGKVNINKY